jgi:hypothetical protein
VLAVVLQWLVMFGLPIVVPEQGGIAVIGGVVGGLAVVLWWLFFSRAAWLERLGAIVVMVVAIVFTLSRGAMLSFIGGLVAVIVVAAAMGRARRTLAAVGILMSFALAYGIWLGLGPFLTRFQYGDLGLRWEMAQATYPMILDFPVLGIGLGTYQEISARYQTLALEPGTLLINHAHNDWLQLLVELGPVGAVLALYAVMRVARDLIGVHLLGRGSCPSGGGEQEWARRSDPFSVGIALGAVGGLVSLGIHSVVDFSARLAASGMLAATLLAVATVALHTRFGSHDGWLAAPRSRTPSGRATRMPWTRASRKSRPRAIPWTRPWKPARRARAR